MNYQEFTVAKQSDSIRVNTPRWGHRINQIKSAFQTFTHLGHSMLYPGFNKEYDAIVVEEVGTEEVPVNNDETSPSNGAFTYVINNNGFTKAGKVNYCTSVRFASADVFDSIEKISLSSNTINFTTIKADQIKVMQHIFNITDDRVVPFHFCGTGNKIQLNTQIEVTVFVKPDSVARFSNSLFVTHGVAESGNTMQHTSMITGNDINLSDTFNKTGVLTRNLDSNWYVTHLVVKVDNTDLAKLIINFSTDDNVNQEDDVQDSVNMQLNVDVSSLNRVDGYYIVPFAGDSRPYFGINFSGNKHSIKAVAVNGDEEMVRQPRIFGVSTNIIMSVDNMMALRFVC